ncbi:MAG: hypothetical protein H7Z76_08430 [Methylotenera sp.]|nr:hypothetical protein [Flavobacterium sp.]
MNTEKKIQEESVVVKGQLIAVLEEHKSVREASDVINNTDAYEWLFVTKSGKTVYRYDVFKLPSAEFPVTVINAKIEIK